MDFWKVYLVLCTLLTGTIVFALTESSVRFVDVAASAGLNLENTFGGKAQKDYILETTGTGAAIFDFDGDGKNDVLIANGTDFGSNKATNRFVHLYRNNGGLKFSEVGSKAGFVVEDWAQGVCVGDYDNDGHPDVLITYYGHNRLYRNTGQGTFVETTGAAKLPEDGTRYGSGCTFVDYDRDGNLDIFVANYVDLDLAKTPKPGSADTCKWKGIDVMCGPRGLRLAKNALYRNNGDGTFTDVSLPAGILKPGGRYALGAVAADFDDDGWPDLYVACDMTPSLLFHNRHDGTFEERGAEAGVAYNADGQLQAGMGVAVADYDGDRRLDIAKTNFSGDLPSLFKNEDGNFFTDVSRGAGLGKRQLLGWGIAFLDVDDDGWKDLMIANGHVYPEVERSPVGDRYLQDTLLYRNLGNSRFEDITAKAGPAFATPRPARGLAVGDLDGDGRPEVVIVNMNGKPSLLRNQVHGGNFLTVKAEGTKSNRSAIGARVYVRAGGRTQMDEFMSGASYYSSHEPALHFGLGGASKVDEIEIRWPNGMKQQWKDIAVNQVVLLTEGKDRLTVLPTTN